MASRKQSFPRNVLQTSKYSLPSASFFVMGLYSFSQSESWPRQGDAKAPEEHTRQLIM